jgi:monodechloroaminopyrrolnitrin synthase
LCDLLGDFHPTDPRFAVLLDALNYELGPMVESINQVVDKVSPKFFARVLRPYFEEIDVDGQTYLGPAAAQVPLWLIDEAVWASDRGEPVTKTSCTIRCPTACRDGGISTRGGCISRPW